MADITVIEVEVTTAPTVIEVEVASTAPTVIEVEVPGEQGPQGDEGPDPWLEPIQTLTGNGALAIDYSAGKHIDLTLTGDTTLTVTGWPVTERIARLTLEILTDGAWTITWPAGTLWQFGQAPTLTDTGRDMILLTSINAGSRIYGHVVGHDYS